MGKWHITITNNETGKVEIDADTNAIIAGVSRGDGTQSLGLTSCGAETLLNCVIGAEDAIDDIFKNTPSLKSVLKLLKKIKENEGE